MSCYGSDFGLSNFYLTLSCCPEDGCRVFPLMIFTAFKAFNAVLFDFSGF